MKKLEMNKSLGIRAGQGYKTVDKDLDGFL
jgi:hypothetical protein